MCEYYVIENVMNAWNVVIKVGGMFKQLCNNLPDVRAKLCLRCNMYQRFLLLCARVLFALIITVIRFNGS